MNWFSYRIEVYKKNKQKDKEYKKLHKLAKEAGEKGGYKKMLDVYGKEDAPLQIIDEEMALLKTQYVKSKIIKAIYSLPQTPIEGDEIWEKGNFTGEWHLTDKGFIEAHNIIRNFKKEQRENISFWVSILFGLLGLVIGLVSIIKN